MSNIRKIDYQLEHYNDRIKPIIARARWGILDIAYNGTMTRHKDVIIWPEGHETWDWRKSDTHHHPGIQIKEVHTLVQTYNCDLIILSTGFEDVLEVDPKTVKWLETQGINFRIMNSRDAINFYNTSTENRIGLLLHSTC